MSYKQGLELDWIGKNENHVFESRILIENNVFGEKSTKNMVIQGDNLLGLKALEQDFTDIIKCIYIDPRCDSKSVFKENNDGLEHSIWLSLMRNRLIILHKLMKSDGVIFVHIDDNEHAYLKLIMDEIFGHSNFITTMVWQKKYSIKAGSKFFSESHEYILVYAKNIESCRINRISRVSEMDSSYKNSDNDPRGCWQSVNLLRREAWDYAIYPIRDPSGKEHMPPKGSSWRYNKDKMEELIRDNRIWFGENENNVPRLKRFLSEVSQSLPPSTWLEHKIAGNTYETKTELGKILPDMASVFSTLKPERLLKYLIEIGSNEGDWVLDSFAGSGTAGAVAHKLNRNYILIESEEKCETVLIPRLQNVIKGEPVTDVSKEVDWKGGGGFKFFKLGPSLLLKDYEGN